eukprot:6433785-Ditylum_brightwellii.AAC.1
MEEKRQWRFLTETLSQIFAICIGNFRGESYHIHDTVVICAIWSWDPGISEVDLVVDVLHVY